MAMCAIRRTFRVMQKRVILWALCAMSLVSSETAQAQATVVDAPDTVVVALDTLAAGGAVEAHWDIANDTDAALVLMVTRTFVDTISPFNYPYQSGEPGAYERFCWGPTCFNYGTDSSPENESFLVTIEPGQADNSFRSDYYPNELIGSTTMRYCFHPVGEPLNGACHDITFVSVEAASVAEPWSQTAALKNVAPNPASQDVVVTFDQAENGLLEFRNLVGQVVRTEPVVAGVSAQRFSVGDLADGLWLVTYSVDGRAVSTMRLIIR